MRTLFTRHTTFYAVITLTILCAGLALSLNAAWWLPRLVFLALSILGVYDLNQTQHAIRRNYPVIGNLRFLFEFIRPEVRQYFFEDDTLKLPFSRVDRSLVYQRAKQQTDLRPFGTQGDVYGNQYEWINHAMTPHHVADTDFRITVGGPDCKKPVDLSVFNISAMSFGALSALFPDLQKGELLEGKFHNTIFRTAWPIMAQAESFDPLYSLSAALSGHIDQSIPESTDPHDRLTTHRRSRP